jgi:plasmid stabilization system protein ParE
MVKQIIWSKRAQSDRKAILEYWILRNKSNKYSRRLNQIFEDSADLISKYPKIGRRTEIPEIRVKIVRDYYMTFLEKETTIEILTIWDCRQEPGRFKEVISTNV